MIAVSQCGVSPSATPLLHGRKRFVQPLVSDISIGHPVTCHLPLPLSCVATRESAAAALLELALVRARLSLPHSSTAHSLTQPLLLLVSFLLVAKIPSGDAAKGAKIFKTKCSQCHTVDKAGGNKQGPNLHGVLGRHAGTVEGFAYTKANSESGIKWLATILTQPTALTTASPRRH